MEISAANNTEAAGLGTAEPLPYARQSRMAVYGGSFDPIHNWHIEIGRQILKNELADEVLFVPAMIPPHKEYQQLAQPMHRLAMVKLVAQENEGFSYTDMELRRSGKSYTYDTITSLMSIYPEYKLVFIMGMDSLCQLSTWYRAAELVQKVDFIIYPRDGVMPPTYISLDKAFGGRLATKLSNSILAASKIPTSTMSSSEIRRRIAAGEDVSSQLPASVLDYIRKNKLYL